MLFQISLATSSLTNAQSLVIRMKDGSQKLLALNSLQRLTFEANNLVAARNNSGPETYNLSEVTKLYFSSGVTALDKPIAKEDERLIIYPNPVRDVINVQYPASTSYLVTICRMDGVMVLKSLLTADNHAIDTGGLTSGFYLLKVNDQTLKFIKQ